MNTNGIYSEIYSFSENSQENFLPHSRGRRAPAGIYTNSVYCMRHYRAAIILYRYLPHTVPQCTVLPPPTRQACACRQIRELRLLYASLSRRDHTLQLFAAYRTAMHRSSLTHAAGVRLQANTRTQVVVCLTFSAAIILYRYLPHTLPKATLSLTHTIPPPDSFLFFYMIRAESFCCTSLYRRARNHKAMRNLSAVQG